jgi:hypothetical protein
MAGTMLVGSPMMQASGDAGLTQVGNQLLDAEAADFLVIAEGQMNGKGRGAVQEVLGTRQRDRDEAFHIRRAAAVQPAVDDRPAERIGGPVLPVPRYRVRMTRKYHTRGFALAQGGEQVGLGFFRIESKPARNP